MKKDTYLPVDCDVYDSLALLSEGKSPVKLFFFIGPDSIDVVSGLIKGIVVRDHEEFCSIDDMEVRLDKIIAINGKPGPAYDLYDAFANACLNCNLGY